MERMFIGVTRAEATRMADAKLCAAKWLLAETEQIPTSINNEKHRRGRKLAGLFLICITHRSAFHRTQQCRILIRQETNKHQTNNVQMFIAIYLML